MRAALSIRVAGLGVVLALASMTTHAQQGTQPPPFTAPDPPTPAAPVAPGQQQTPSQQQPQAAPDAPLPRPDKTSVDLRDLPGLATQPMKPAAASQAAQHAADSNARPRAEASPIFTPRWFSFIAPYRPIHVPALPEGSPMALDGMLRDGKLYLSLHDAITLAIANNLDVEIGRYDLLLAEFDITRAQGGGSLRGLDYTILQTPPGVGSLTSPLLITSSNGTNTPTNVNISDLSQVTQSGTGMQQTLSESDQLAYSQGPAVPLFDGTVFGEASYLRRSDQSSLESATAGANTGTTTGTTASTGAQDYTSVGFDYQQGFSTGAQLDAFVTNASQVLYAGQSQYNPFHAPSISATISQPLVRGFGAVNRRFIRIGKINQQVSRLLFEQQLLETVYGVSRLYYDLVSLGENIGVKEQSLAAAQRLLRDDQDQVDEGTLAPIELTRAKALVSSNRLDLIQAQAEYRQQEVILKEQLLRKLGDPALTISTIIPTDQINVPDSMPAIDLPALITEALASRPDLVQAGLQLKTDEIYAASARNNVKPLLNAYANVETRGSSLVPFETLGSAGNGVAITPAELTQGGLRLSTIYQGGIQVTLPLRNRIAQADAARDAVQLRQAQGRAAKLENDIRQQIESASIALESAHQAYGAAVESSNYQQQLLQAELDKFAVGESTNYQVIQDQAYLAQARSTEVAARSDWMKARLSLDRALGNLLENNHVEFEDAVRGLAK